MTVSDLVVSTKVLVSGLRSTVPIDHAVSPARAVDRRARFSP